MESHEKAIVPRLNEDAITAFIVNHLGSANLLQSPRDTTPAQDRTFTSNSEFWNAILSRNARPLSWIELPSMQLCDWLPRSPGLYHTERARSQRNNAQRHLVDEEGVLHYRPEGKTDMIAGGIGAVRFCPISIEGDDHWLCTATSDHYCHTGIPLAIPDSLMRDVDLQLAGIFRIFGQLRFLPEFLENRFRHYSRVPQIYIQVSEVRQISDTGFPITLTPMVFFDSDGEYGQEHNVTYVQCHAVNDIEFDLAAEWIEQYVGRYGKNILTNFDQQRPAFANVPFSLQAVMSNRVNASALESLYIYNAHLIQPQFDKIFAKDVNVSTEISVKLGDGTVIHGDMVVANSIKDSFNRAANSVAADPIKDLIKELAVAVGKLTESMDKEAASEVARDLDALVAEATSKAPRKKWWALSMDGISTAAEKVAGVGKPVLEILAKLTPLLMAGG